MNESKNRIFFFFNVPILGLIFNSVCISCTVEEKSIANNSDFFHTPDNEPIIINERVYTVMIQIHNYISGQTNLENPVHLRAIHNNSDSSSLNQILSSIKLSEECSDCGFAEQDYLYSSKIDTTGRMMNTSILQRGYSDWCTNDFQIQIDEIIQEVKIISPEYFNKEVCIRVIVRSY